MRPIIAVFVMASIIVMGGSVADSSLTANGLSSNGMSINRLSSNELSNNGISSGFSNGLSANARSSIQPALIRNEVSDISKPVESSNPGYEAYPPSAADMNSIANAKALSEFFKDYIEWCMNNPESATSIHDIEIYAASNQQDNTVSYITGILQYSDESGVFEGQVKQYFNNRMWNIDTLTNPYQKAAPAILYPFDPTRTEDLSISLDTTSGIATITHNGGYGVETVDLQPANGVLYGFTTSGTPSMYMVSLKKHKSPV